MTDEDRLREYLTRVIAELRDTRQRLRTAESGDQEPIAIVGMGCRLPGGVNGPEDLWRVVTEGVDAVGPIPTDRGFDVADLFDADPDNPSSDYAVYSAAGGFVPEATLFDPGFFGINQREALAMDPQQRMILEVCWETVERAGLAPTALRGTRTGVFVGASGQGYGAGAMHAFAGSEGYVVTGSATSVVSGRVAYTMGLEGPALTVDTACSSSLVALHLAVQALRQGECTMALAGGVTVIPNPLGLLEFSRQRALAEDGRCKAFAASADGMGLAEGAAVLMLERLGDARRNGHRVLAVVRGTAANQDGASNGLTAPNGPSQQRVIKQALADARLSPEQVDAVEAHGTGTRLGDPIEAQALLATYGQSRTAARPLYLGALKSNIGHTQQTSGVAGVIKMVLAIQHGVLPRTLHVDAPTPHVNWSSGDVRLLTEELPWPVTGEPRRAGISSFGLSGTNVHTLIEQAPAAEETARPAPTAALPAVPWVLSARTPTGLRLQADALRRHLDHTTAAPVDLGHSLVTTRALHEYRAVVVAAGSTGLSSGLAALAAGDTTPAVVTGTAGPGRTAFLFPGQACRRAGLGRELYAAFPAFAKPFDQICAYFTQLLERPLRDLALAVPGSPESELLDGTLYSQPATFAVEVALYRLLESWGVTADVLVGHSFGEIAAAHVSGVLSLEDACALVAVRSRLMDEQPAEGAMLVVRDNEEAVRAALADHTGQLDIAAVNGPDAVVVAGDAAAVTELRATLQARGRTTERLAVPHAFHSPLADAMLTELGAIAGQVPHETPTIPLVSTVTGAPVGDDMGDGRHWVRHARQTVRWADAVDSLRRDGVTRVLALGPAGLLLDAARTLLEGRLPGQEPVLVTALGGDQPEAATVLRAVAGLSADGAETNWAAVFEGTGATAVDLPTTVFEHQRYWPEAPLIPAAEAAPTADADPAEAAFWDAVERQDQDRIAATIGLSGDEVAPVLPALSRWRQRRRTDRTVDSWRYRIRWHPLSGLPAGRLTGTWLVVSPQGTDTAALTGALRRGGAETAELVVDPAAPDRADLAERLRDGAYTGIVGLLDTVGTLLLAQAVGDVGLDARLWAVTSGAVSVGRSDPLRSPAAAEVWGVGRVVALEQPQSWGGLVDVPERLDERAGARLVAALCSTEDQTAVRASGVFGRRLHRAAPVEPAEPVRPDGTVLVTGGTGALGGQVARWLAARGTPHVILLSRRGRAADGVTELVAQLNALGTRVTVEACDVSDRDALAAVLAGERLTGVVHVAGVLDDATLSAQTPERFARVLGAKARPADHLHELTAGDDLRFFVMFSSFAGSVGNAGQANYAAANAHLDALAEHRRGLGLPAASLAWGPWAEAGLATEDLVADRMRRGGFAAMDPALGIEVMAAAIDGDAGDLTVADVDWSAFAPAFCAARPSPLLADLPEARAALTAATTAAGAGGELRAELAAVPAGQRAAVLLDILREQAASVLGHGSADRVDGVRPFRDLGFDSLTSLELRNRLGAATGLALPASLVFDYPTPVQLADHLLERTGLDTAAEAEAVAATTTTATTATASEPIAVVAMSCRFPGGVDSPERLWQMLVDGGEGLCELPTDRGWPELPMEFFSPYGSFLQNPGHFDAGLFGISPREALAMDPQQRLLLETSWETLERAGIDPRSLRGADVGVFVGGSGTGYGIGAALPEGTEGHLMTGNATSVMSGRISYTYGLEGPAVTVDTACSSSLVATHLAVQALRNGECGMALAGGVTVMSTPTVYAEFGRQGALSVDGRCKSFGATADGTGWGEGAGLVLLERLSDARRLGHQVLAVIRGTAVNQDGASNGLSAPNGPSQQRVIRRALANGGLTTDDIDAVEAHGSGTKLGDPIEAEALLATYGKDRPADRPLWLGSVKSNIGHAQSAAGVAGIMKMVLALHHGQLPRTMHVDEPSPHIDWSAGGVELLRRPVGWTRGERVRRAGVSAFGISGTNAHVIVEEAPPPVGADPVPTAEPPAVPWLLSARTADGLRAQARRLREYAAGTTDRPVDTAHTLATGRAVLDHRAVVWGRDRDELARALEPLATGATAPARSRPGRPAFAFTAAAPAGGEVADIADALLTAFPAFVDAFHDVCARLDDLLDRPLLTLLAEDPAAPADPCHDQAAWFAVQTGLARLLTGWGLRPVRLTGTGVGAVVAAHLRGELELAEACARAVRTPLADDPATPADPDAGAGTVLTFDETLLGDDPAGDVLRAVGALHEQGTTVDWAAVFEPWGARLVPAPTYPFQRRHFWLTGTPVADEPGVWVLGADSEQALRSQARRLAGHLARRPESAGTDVGVTLTDGALHRSVVVAADRADLGPALLARAAHEPHDAVYSGVAPGTRDAVFVFPGQGSQWPGMAAELFRTSQPFRDAFTACADALARHVDWSPEDVLLKRPQAPGLDRVDVVQPMLFAVMVALAETWRAAGVEPVAVIGHSQGEIAAMRVAGALGLDDAARLVARRSRIVAELAPHGGMMSIAAPAAEITEMLTAWPERLSVAAVNGPRATVVSGDAEALDGLLDVCEERGLSARRVPVDYASHSHHVESMREALLDEFATLSAGPSDVAVYSTVTGARIDTDGLDSVYWYRNLREPVRFADAVLAAAPGDPLFLEMSPHPVLTSATNELIADTAALSLGTLRRQEGGPVRMLAALAEAYVHGAAVDWTTLPGRVAQMSPARTADDWLHHVAWEPVVLPPGAPDGTWVLTAPAEPGLEELATTVAEALRGAGARAETRPQDTVLEFTEPVAGVVQFTSGATWRLPGGSPDMPRWLITRGAVGVGPDDPVTDPGQATVWGLGRSVTLDRVDPGTRLVDLPAAEQPGTVDALLRVLADGKREQAAVRGDTVWTPALARTTEPLGDPWRPTGTVLVTGSTGPLARRLSTWLTSHGATRVVTVAADASADDAQRCDLSDRDAVAALLERTGPLDAVLHLAAVTDRPVRDQVEAVRHLHELTADQPLTAFVAFAPAAGVWGDEHHAERAAAGAYLEAFAQHLRAEGRPATTVAWGPWDLPGDPMAAQEHGLTALDPDVALDVLAHVATGTRPAVLVADVRWPEFAGKRSGQFVAGVVAETPTAPAAPAGPAPVAPAGPAPAAPAAPAGPAPAAPAGPVTEGAWRAGLLAVTGDDRRRAALARIREQAAAVLGFSSAEEVEPEERFLSQGFDSLMSVEMGERLSKGLGLELSVEVMFDHPSADRLAAHVTELLDGVPGGATLGISPDDRNPVGLLNSLYLEAIRTDRVEPFMRTVQEAARFRPVFSSVAELTDPPRPVQLARGDNGPRLICQAGVTAAGGPHEFVRFAATFQGRRNVSVLSLPGFGRGELLPADTEVTFDFLTESVRQEAGDEPFVLVAHSGGGLVAHALVTHLESVGIQPAGLALLDTYTADHSFLDVWKNELSNGAVLRTQQYVPMDDVRLTAQAAYSEVVSLFGAQEVRTPTLLVRATEPLGAWDREEDWRTVWNQPHTLADVPGNHFTMMVEHADTTAAAVETWLASLG